MRLANSILRMCALFACGAVGPFAERTYAQEQADVADVPAQDLTVGGNLKMQYYLIGAAAGAAAPDEPYGLLVVLPGGDGSADFNPFLRRLHKHALGSHWLLAQAVAPQWDDKQFDKAVWPTAGLPYAGAKFTTEEFIEGIIADARARTKIDARRIFLLGWSSGGPACYATMLRKKSPVTGAFIAMSVFKPGQMPVLANAKDKSVFCCNRRMTVSHPCGLPKMPKRRLAAAGAKGPAQKICRRSRLAGRRVGDGRRGNSMARKAGRSACWNERPVAGHDG